MGQSVTFTCAALSDKKPHFSWVWVSSHDSTPFHKVMNSSMSLPNIRFQEMKRTVEGGTSYLQKLKLLNVSKSDQGRYACIVGHDGRKNISSYVHLVVRQLKRKYFMSLYFGDASIILMTDACVCFFVLFLSLYFCLYICILRILVANTTNTRR